MFITDQLKLTAERHGLLDALIDGERRLTWSELDEQSDKVARALVARGVRRSEQVAVWLPNVADWLVIWFGAMKVGATLVPINTRYKAAEAHYVLKKSDSVILFLSEPFLGIDYVARFREMSLSEAGATQALPKLRDVVVLADDTGGLDHALSWSEFIGGAEAVVESTVQEMAEGRSLDDAVVIVFTSGTTGFPKGVIRTHESLRAIKPVCEILEVTSDDRVLGHLPLFHVAGVLSSFIPALISGAALVMVQKWEATVVLDLVAKEKISILSGIPTHFIDLIRHPDLEKWDVSSLRIGWIGGSTVPREVIEKSVTTLGMDALLPVYGMTEAGPCLTLGRRTDGIASLAAGRGVPLGGYEVRIVDPLTREPLGVDEEGEIAARGFVIMKGYYNDEAETAKVLSADGWFYTSDLGRIDEDGYLSITGRKGDKFIVGGNNVHPADIEHVLMAHEAVKQALVVARPDDRLGEAGVAFIELAEGAELSQEDAIAYCRSKLAAFKVPRDVHFVDSWPTTPTGKIQRFRLRERATAKGD